MLLNGYFTSSATAVLVRLLVVRRHCPLSRATPNNLGHRPIDHRRCLEPTPEARKTSITIPSVIFSSLGSCYPWPETGASVTVVHACIAALYSLQINCTTQKIAVQSKSPSNEQHTRGPERDRQKKKRTHTHTPHFRTYSRRALFDLPELCMVIEEFETIKKVSIGFRSNA